MFSNHTKTNFNVSVTLFLLSANFSIWTGQVILSFGKELKQTHNHKTSQLVKYFGHISALRLLTEKLHVTVMSYSKIFDDIVVYIRFLHMFEQEMVTLISCFIPTICSFCISYISSMKGD